MPLTDLSRQDRFNALGQVTAYGDPPTPEECVKRPVPPGLAATHPGQEMAKNGLHPEAVVNLVGVRLSPLDVVLRIRAAYGSDFAAGRNVAVTVPDYGTAYVGPVDWYVKEQS